MGRCCAVNGCLIDRKLDKDRDALNAHKYSLFKVPKDPDLLRKWSGLIGQELSSTDYVCHLHFDPTDIIREDRKISLDEKGFKILPERGCSPQLQQENNILSIHPVANADENDFPIDAILDSSTSSNDDLAHVDCTTQSPGAAEDSVWSASEDHQLSIDDICDALKVRPLPSNWSWMLHREKSIILSYLDAACWKPKCHMKIKNNLTVEIINAYTDVSLNIKEIISKIDTVWHVLTWVDEYFFCNGIGLDGIKCSSNCKGMISCSDYKKKMTEYRCAPCRRERQGIQNRNNKKKKYFEVISSKKIELSYLENFKLI